ncbi:MAG: hypothetical protein EXR52_01235, partial [Dehalococcoidia bacterium]|nr:hypothetical protein [Dehalococcoidia bacterium]
MAHSRSDYLLVLAPIWAPIAGLFFALLSFSVLHEVSRGILTPEEVSFWLPEAYEHLGWGVPVLAAITLGRFRRWLGVIFMVGAVFGYASGSCMHGGILSSGPLLHGAQDAPATLSFAAPVRNWDDGPYEYDRFDSETMSRIFPHQAYRQQYQMEFNFVPAEQASTGPTVVSVHPIDRWNWGAAGL